MAKNEIGRGEMVRERMRRSVARLVRPASLLDLSGIVGSAFILFTAEGCDLCHNAVFILADLVPRYKSAVTICWATLEANQDIVLSYAVDEFPSAIVLRDGKPVRRIPSTELLEPERTRKVLNDAAM